VAALDAPDQPRVAWSMVPAGDVTAATVAELAERLAPGDVVVDGGNANFRDSLARAEALAARGIGFVDCGTSGGVWGRDAGYALMVGGADEHVAAVAPLLEALAPPSGFAHVGPAGAGHFAKMVHNAVEYGMMQAFAEGYALLDAAPLPVDVPATLQSWQEGSVVRSWLLDLLVRALDERPGLEGVPAVASDSGEGRWAVTEAVAAGVPVPVTTAALFARFASQRPDDPALKAIAALRNQFGGHPL
jgi:6-phosphogluconate dehydrogenase